MSNFIIALIVAVGAGAWIYNKLMRNTGNIAKTSLTASGIISVFIFIVIFIILGMINK